MNDFDKCCFKNDKNMYWFYLDRQAQGFVR